MLANLKEAHSGKGNYKHFGDVFEGDEHDLIVPMKSQIGGLKAMETTELGWKPNDHFGLHTTVITEPKYNNAAIELLNVEVSHMRFAKQIPANAAQQGGGAGGGGGGGGDDPPPDGGIVITMPAFGTPVAAGAMFFVQAEAWGDYVPQSVLFVVEDDWVVVEERPFETLLRAPLNAIGPRTVGALAIDTAGIAADADNIEIDVFIDGVLTEISVNPNPVTMFHFTPERQITVFALYSNGSQIDVTDDAGTTFVSDDIDVAIVDKNGIVTAVGVGEAVVTAVHAGLEATAFVDVVSVVPPTTTDDLDGDGSIGIGDLLLLLAAWGDCPPIEEDPCPADLTGDGKVGIADLLTLLANWSTTSP